MRNPCTSIAILLSAVGVLFTAAWPRLAAASEFNVIDVNANGNGGAQKLGIGTTFGRWPDGVVPYVYNPTGKPAVFMNNAYFVGLLQEAMAELEGVAGIVFEYQGIDSNAVLTNFNDGVVVVGWEDIGGAAGQAGPAFSCTGQDLIDIGYCAYVDGRVRFNNNVAVVDWDTGVADFTERGFHQVATHELMHLAGIGHSELAESIMYADPYTNLSHLRADDIDALQSLYGEPGAFLPASAYSAPGAGASPLSDSFISLDDDIGTPITEIDGTQAATFAGLLWSVPGGHMDDLTIIVTDPQGYYYAGQVDDRNCPGGICGFWTSIARLETLHTFPGVWTANLIMNGNLIASESVTVTTAPVFNQAPDSTLAHDVIYGPAPLTVSMKLAVTGDNEGDAVGATWHIPTIGEIALNSGNFPGSAGEDTRTVTFDTPGEYEIFVEVNDDWTRYGAGGSAAGPGFRSLYRRVVRVTSVSDDITTFRDVSGDSIPDLAGFVGAYTKKPRIAIYSGDHGGVESKINFLTASWRGIGLGTVRDADQDGTADDPAVAMLADNKTSGKISVQTRRLDTGAALGKISFLSAKWRAVDIAVIDDLNGDGNTNDTAIAVLGQHKVNGKIKVQMRRLASGALVRNIDFLNPDWSAIAIGVVDRSGQVPMGGLSPLLGMLAENNVNGKRYLQSRLVSTGALDRNVTFLNEKWNLRDVTVVHDVNGNGVGNDPAWQVLAVRDSDHLIRVQTRHAGNGSLDSNIGILNQGWEGFRLDSAADMNGNASHELAVSTRKRSSDKRRIQVKDYQSAAVILNINP